MHSVRPGSPWRGRLVAIVLTLATILALPSAAAAQRTATSLADRVARSLEASPVVVHAPLTTVITPAAKRDLVRKVRASGQPILLALVPLVEGDQYGGEARRFVAALRDRLGRDGIYVAVEDRYLRTFEYRGGDVHYGGAADLAMMLANYAGQDDSAYRRSQLERVRMFLEYVQLPVAELQQRLEAYEKDRDRRVKQFPGARGEEDEGSVFDVLVIGAIVLLSGFGWRWLRRRTGARPATEALPVLPDRVFEHARAAHRANLREDADDELLKLSALLDDQPMPRKPAAQEAYQRALDAYAAARRRSGSEAPTVDLVGALVLVDHARHDLAMGAAIDAGRKPPTRTALCVFDPLHGRAARQVHWQHEGRRLDVPACKACADALRHGRTPDALRDGDVPYFEADTVWARTGFGTLADDLVARVSRGER